jgi:hypothetical protein
MNTVFIFYFLQQDSNIHINRIISVIHEYFSIETQISKKN